MKNIATNFIKLVSMYVDFAHGLVKPFDKLFQALFKLAVSKHALVHANKEAHCTPVSLQCRNNAY